MSKVSALDIPFHEQEIVFIKLGRSVVTNIETPYSARIPIIQQFAHELARVMKARPDLKIIIGHGSGSFGRTAAKEQLYDEKKGFPSVNAAAIVAKAALDLHAMIIGELVKAGVPAFSMPPSATGMVDQETKRLISMDILQIKRILDLGGVPLVFGDVIPCTDGKGAHIVSTEEIFSFLGKHFQPSEIFLLGEVLLGEMEDIYNYFAQHPSKEAPMESGTVPAITPELWTKIHANIENRRHTKVTQDMVKRVNTIMDLVKKNPEIKIYVASGIGKGNVENILVARQPLSKGMILQAHTKKNGR